MKKILRNSFVQWLLSWVVHKYCLLSFYTSRVEFENSETFNKLYDQKKPIIIAFWHGRLIFSPFVCNGKQRKRVYTIVSKHGDGALISQIVRMFGVGLIRGSTNRTSKNKRGAKNRGGREVLAQSIKLLKAGNIVAYTPDGPRGPARKINEMGMIKVASHTSATILPVTIYSSNATFFKSWDSFMLPHPFGKVKIIVGAMIEVDKNADNNTLENTGKKLEDSLNYITKLADESYAPKVI